MRDWLRSWKTDSVVTCIACGGNLDREDAREYDKQGDRWDRENKTFEYMCKDCHKTYKHAPRDEVRNRAQRAAERATSQEEFVHLYVNDWEKPESND